MKKNALIVLVSFVVMARIFASADDVTNSLFSFRDAVLDFSDTGISENVRNGDFEVSTPSDLKVGSIFLDVDNKIKKVVNITEASDGTVYIDTIQPEIMEAFDYMYVPEQTLSIAIPELTQAAVDASDGRLSIPEQSLQFYLDSDKTIRVGITGVKGTLKLDGKFSYKLPSISGQWKKYWFIPVWVPSYNSGYVNAKYTSNLGVAFAFELTASVKDKLWKDYPLAIYGACGDNNSLSAGIYLQGQLNGKFGVKIGLTYRNVSDANVSCDLDGLYFVAVPHNMKADGTSITYQGYELDVNASATLKIGPALMAKVMLFGYTFGKISIGVYGSASMKGQYGYLARNNELVGDWGEDQQVKQTGWYSGTATGKSTGLSFTIGLGVEGNADVFNGKGSWQFLDYKIAKATLLLQ